MQRFLWENIKLLKKKLKKIYWIENNYDYKLYYNLQLKIYWFDIKYIYVTLINNSRKKALDDLFMHMNFYFIHFFHVSKIEIAIK